MKVHPIGWMEIETLLTGKVAPARMNRAHSLLCARLFRCSRGPKEFAPDGLRPRPNRSVVAVMANTITADVTAYLEHLAVAGDYHLCYDSWLPF